MANDTDNQIRAAIAGLISGVQPDAVVWPYNVLSHDIREWPGLIRVASPINANGWIIKQSVLAATRKTAFRDRQTLTYECWGFYGFRTGKAGDNSDDEFSIRRDIVYEAIKAEPRLGLDSLVEYHDLLQYLYITTLNTGEEVLHFAHGQLTVHLCC